MKSTTWKPTAVQQDVINRLKDGWELHGFFNPELKKDSEAPRHVGSATVESLQRRGFIKCDWGHPIRWVLVDPPEPEPGE